MTILSEVATRDAIRDSVNEAGHMVSDALRAAVARNYLSVAVQLRAAEDALATAAKVLTDAPEIFL